MKSALGVFGLWGGGTAVAVLCFWLLAGVATRAPATAASPTGAGTIANQQAAASAPTSTPGAPAVATTSPPTPQPTLPLVASSTTAPAPAPTAAPTQLPAAVPTQAPTVTPPTAAPTNTAAAPAPTAIRSVQAQPTATSGAIEQPSPEQLAATPGSYVGHRVIVNGAVERCGQEARWYTCQIHEGSASNGPQYYVLVQFAQAPPGVQPGVGVGVTGTVIGTGQLPGGGAAGPVVPIVRAEQVAIGN